MKASEPSAARSKSDFLQHLEEPGGAALPLHCAQHRGQRPLRPGRAAPRAERHGRGAGSGPARAGRCAEPSLPPGRAGGCRRRTTASPAPLPASRPLWVALHLKPRRSAKPSSEPARPRLLPARAHPHLFVLAPAARGEQQTLGLRGSLPRSSTDSTAVQFRLETLANSYLQPTRLKTQPKPELLPLSGLIQNSSHQLKSVKNPRQARTLRDVLLSPREFQVFPSSCAAQALCCFLLARDCPFHGYCSRAN